MDKVVGLGFKLRCRYTVIINMIIEDNKV